MINSIGRGRICGTWRVLAVIIAISIYIVLLIVDALCTPTSLIPFSFWLSFGFSAFVALVFLAVGVLVWLYARERSGALLLFLFCCAAAVTFIVQTAALGGTRFFTMIAGLSSILALGLCSLLVLQFPIPYLPLIFSSRAASSHRAYNQRSSIALTVMRAYIIVLALFGCVAAVYALSDDSWRLTRVWLYNLALIYVFIALAGIITTTIISYYRTGSTRQKQQISLFVLSVLLSHIPFLVVTLLPKLLHLAPQFIIDPQFSTVSSVFLPLALGYSILRYQVLVLDTYIRRTASWVIGVVALAVVGYGILAVATSILPDQGIVLVVVVTSAALILAPLVWCGAKKITGFLFFRELLHYQHMIDKPAVYIDEAVSLEEAAGVFIVAAEQAFETSSICLFVLDEGSGYYQLCPPLKEGITDTYRSTIIQTLLHTNSSRNNKCIDRLEVHSSLIDAVSLAHRPVLLSEIKDAKRRIRSVMNHYLISAPAGDDDNLLLAPVRAQGRMIGLLVLGKRRPGVNPPYAGPDFEAVQLILGRFSSLLETARLYARANQQADLLNALYSNMPAEAFQSVKALADSYIARISTATSARGEIWLRDDDEAHVRCMSVAGVGPALTLADTLHIHATDWQPCFAERDEALGTFTTTGSLPACLSAPPLASFAWLPLIKGEQRLGVIVLLYALPHHFMREETRTLEMFAHQCAEALVNVNMTIALLAAYERQKELDHLKDQFIMTASHELRTPLTAVQGYIELLSEYNSTLPADARANFIARAHRGCDELTLLVGNIMDASRLQIEASNVRLSAIPLDASVQHVLEILEAIIKREQRTVRIEILPAMHVLADDIRLRQVLLNLVSNALKYSPPATALSVSASLEDEMVTVRVRDYGAGVPEEDQYRLFERFTRLDRDMNSPIRGAGLGLYICKQLVEAMGGRIWIESRGIAGEGSVFAFNLQSVDVQQQLPHPYPHSDLSLS